MGGSWGLGPGLHVLGCTNSPEGGHVGRQAQDLLSPGHSALLCHVHHVSGPWAHLLRLIGVFLHPLGDPQGPRPEVKKSWSHGIAQGQSHPGRPGLLLLTPPPSPRACLAEALVPCAHLTAPPALSAAPQRPWSRRPGGGGGSVRSSGAGGSGICTSPQSAKRSGWRPWWWPMPRWWSTMDSLRWRATC